MPNNPYDDFFKNLAHIVEDMMKNLPQQENTRFIGCTIIAGNPNDLPRIFQGLENDPDDVPYEVIESEDWIFITAELPYDVETPPYAEIRPEVVDMCIDETKTSIDLNTPVDVSRSYFKVRNNILDIVLKKAEKIKQDE